MKKAPLWGLFCHLLRKRCFRLTCCTSIFSNTDTIKLTTAPTAARIAVRTRSPELILARMLTRVPPAVPALVPDPSIGFAIAIRGLIDPLVLAFSGDLAHGA